MESVRVAVRVRPFNQREKDRNAKCIIQMPVDRPGLCGILNPADGKTHEFTFDFAYWSHDHSREFSSQDVVYQDMGADILGKCFEGYNFTLFAYGQTGAGKSYSMMGAGDIRGSEAGIIPRVCAGLFEKIAELKAGGSETQYKVEAGFLEIYNEKIRDLLDTHADPKSAGLKIRESKQLGIYVEGQKKMPVGCYEDVERVLETGNMNRTVGATAMNAVSSRSHSVFTITFTQTKVMKETLSASDTISKLNLVDLAGSERANSTGATGDRLKEGCAINKSLSALGNVISALAKNSQGGKKKELVPYRDSTLTRLLQESLGGNSITTMIAALSPADINYDETLSTLRYADRAKQIKNAAKRNENPNERIIRELKEEIERLKAALGGNPAALAGAGGAGVSEEMEREMAAKDRIIREMNSSWEEKLQKAVEEERARAAQMALLGIGSADKPHLLNLNEDPIMSETCLYDVRTEGETIIGCGSGDDSAEKPTVTLEGAGIMPIHCKIVWKGLVKKGTSDKPPYNKFQLVGLAGAELYHNGDQIVAAGSTENAKPIDLHHGDRLLLGQNNWFRFVDPITASWFAEEAKSRGTTYKPPLLDYDFAKRELTRKKLHLGNEEEDLEKAMQEKMRKLEEDYQKQLEAKMREYDSEKQKKEMEREQERIEAERQAEMKKLQLEQARAERQAQNKRVLENTITDLMTPITRANYYSEVLGKGIVYDLDLMTTLDVSDPQGGMISKVNVKMTDTVTSRVSTFTPEEFMERYYAMFDMCEDLLLMDEDERSKVPQPKPEDDPFVDLRQDTSKLIGTATFLLTPLWYGFDSDSRLGLVGSDSVKKCGELVIYTTPVPPPGPDGEPQDLEDFAECELFEVGKRAEVRIDIQQVCGLPREYRRGCYVQYRWWNETKYRTSPASKDVSSNPMINWSQNIVIDPVTEEFQAYLKDTMLVFEVWASPSLDGISSVRGDGAAQQSSHNHSGKPLTAMNAFEEEGAAGDAVPRDGSDSDDAPRPTARRINDGSESYSSYSYSDNDGKGGSSGSKKSAVPESTVKAEGDKDESASKKKKAAETAEPEDAKPQVQQETPVGEKEGKGGGCCALL